MLDQAPLSNAKEARGMSEKSDEKCLNPTTCPLIMNVEHDLQKLHIIYEIRAGFLLHIYFFLLVIQNYEFDAVFVSLFL